MNSKFWLVRSFWSCSARSYKAFFDYSYSRFITLALFSLLFVGLTGCQKLLELTELADLDKPPKSGERHERRPVNDTEDATQDDDTSGTVDDSEDPSDSTDSNNDPNNEPDNESDNEQEAPEETVDDDSQDDSSDSTDSNDEADDATDDEADDATDSDDTQDNSDSTDSTNENDNAPLVPTFTYSDQKIVLVEEFGASWCGPCRPVAEKIEVFMEDYEGTLALIRYPSSGGIYRSSLGDEAKKESKKRKNLYGVRGIPAVFIDGDNSIVGHSNGFSNKFEKHINNHFAVEVSLAIDTIKDGDIVRVGLKALVGMADIEIKASLVEIEHTFDKPQQNRQKTFQGTILQHFGTQAISTLAKDQELELTFDYVGAPTIDGRVPDNIGIIVFAWDPVTNEVFQADILELSHNDEH